MSDAAPSPTTTADADVHALVAELQEAREDLERARERVDEVGESTLRDLESQYDALTSLFNTYEERVTGDGDFQTFIEFQGKIAEFTEELPEDTRRREVFEDVDELLQQRRLTESDWARVRETLEPVRDDVDRLRERENARERYSKVRYEVQSQRDELEERIADLERLQRLGDADLDAPTDRLRDPVETYNECVTESFDTFRREASARDVLDFLAKTDLYPLVDFPTPPADLKSYVDEREPGTEPITQLREWADFSRSKLDHYVDDPDALKRAVSTHMTYLRRVDADPLTVSWPPPEPDVLRYRCRELESVVARVANADEVSTGEEALVALREVRDLPQNTDYERLRTSAQARSQLTDEERERLASGAVEDELAAARDGKDRLEDALNEYPSL